MLLLDEPFGALDAKVRRELRRWLREIHDRTGHTTVFVTHDQEEAIELADRIVVLNQRPGSSRSARPTRSTTARRPPSWPSFIGETNALPVSVESGKLFLDDRPLEIGAGAASDGPRMLVFRPHDVEMLNGAPRRHRRPRRLRAPPRRRPPPRGRDRHAPPPIEIDVPADDAEEPQGRPDQPPAEPLVAVRRVNGDRQVATAEIEAAATPKRLTIRCSLSLFAS